MIILVITCMQGMYSYVPETNRVSRVYNVATLLYLQSLLHAMLIPILIMYLYISTSRSVCAVPNTAVL
jgi:hypothetical protein